MNQLVSIATTPLTMSTREIASLLGKNHSDIKRSAERLYVKGALTQPLAGSDFEHNGNRYQEYLLEKRDCLVLVAQNSPEFTALIVDRWQELENQSNKNLPDFTNPAEAARAWAEQFEQNQIAQQQLIEQKPKVEFVDNFVEVGTTKTLRETAKILGYPERKMINCLLNDKVLYRQSGNLLPYQNRHEQGLFQVKTGERNGYAYTQTRVTTKGVEWLANRYASELL